MPEKPLALRHVSHRDVQQWQARKQVARPALSRGAGAVDFLPGLGELGDVGFVAIELDKSILREPHGAAS